MLFFPVIIFILYNSTIKQDTQFIHITLNLRSHSLSLFCSVCFKWPCERRHTKIDFILISKFFWLVVITPKKRDFNFDDDFSICVDFFIPFLICCILFFSWLFQINLAVIKPNRDTTAHAYKKYKTLYLALTWPLDAINHLI